MTKRKTEPAGMSLFDAPALPPRPKVPVLPYITWWSRPDEDALTFEHPGCLRWTVSLGAHLGLPEPPTRGRRRCDGCGATLDLVHESLRPEADGGGRKVDR